MAAPKRKPVIFISYSHRDRTIKNRLVQHIICPGEVDFELWEDDSKIQTGDDWRQKIADGLARADAGVLLISIDFLTSNFIKSVEVPKLLDKRAYPILIGYCAWRNVKWLEKLQMRTDDGEPLARRGRKLDRVLVKVAEEMADLFAFKPAVGVDADPIPLPAIPESPVRVDPDEYLAIVLGKDLRTGPVLNLRCRVRNDGALPATILRLEIELTDPYGSSFSLKWNLFYESTLHEGTLVHRKTADAHPLELQPQTDRWVGVQFAGPPSVTDYGWSQGTHGCVVKGWLAEATVPERPDIITRCEIEVTPEAAKSLIYWSVAGAMQWKALNDPDDAVGIPVTISRRPALHEQGKRG